MTERMKLIAVKAALVLMLYVIAYFTIDDAKAFTAIFIMVWANNLSMYKL